MATIRLGRYAFEYRSDIDKALNSIGNLAVIMQNKDQIGRENRRKYFNTLLFNELKRNPDYLSVWAISEKNALDNLDSRFINREGGNNAGRYDATFYWLDGAIKMQATQEEDTTNSDYYLLPKKNRTTVIMNPYYYSYDGGKTTFYEISLIEPVLINQVYLGIVGIDLNLAGFMEKTKNIRPYGSGYLSLISDDGIYVTHLDTNKIGTSMTNQNESDPAKKIQALNAIKNGKPFLTTEYSKTLKSSVYRVYTPLRIGNSVHYWSLLVSIPLKELMRESVAILWQMILSGLCAFIVITIALLVLSKKITGPIDKVARHLEHFSKGSGDLTDKIDIPSESRSADVPRIMLTMLKISRSVRRSRPMPRNQTPTISASSMFHMPSNTMFQIVLKMVSST